MKKQTPKKLKDKCDKLMSIYIRLRYSNDDGWLKCYTCDNVKSWKEMQNGHFVSRTHLSTRWLSKNCRPQCMPCNVWKNGNYDVYSLRLVEECGSGVLEELNRLRNETVKMGLPAYRELIDNLNTKIDNLNKQHLYV